MPSLPVHETGCAATELIVQSRDCRSRRRPIHECRDTGNPGLWHRSFLCFSADIRDLGARLLIQANSGQPWQEALGAADLLTRQELGVLEMVPKQQDQQHPGTLPSETASDGYAVFCCLPLNTVKLVLCSALPDYLLACESATFSLAR